MERLNLSIERYQVKKESKASFSYQELAEEIADKYQVPWKRFIWLFYKVPEHLIRQAFKESSTIEQLVKYAQQLNKHK